MKNLKLIIIAGLFLVNCTGEKPNYTQINGFTQGTTYSITFENNSGMDIQDDIENILANFDSSLSIYNKQSVISKINTNQSYKTDTYLKIVFKKSKEIFNKTNGAFDITVAPLVNLWGFGFKEKEKATKSKIDSILEFIGLNKIILKDSLFIKSDPRIMLDVNAIAQGYSVDIIADFLTKKEIKNYLIEIGGEIKAKGVNKKGKIWKVGIDKPFDNNNIPGEKLQAIISLENKSLATSGNYRKFYIENGIKYSHTINPQTGYPVNHSLLSVTVITDECITADAYATAFMVMGMDMSLELIQKMQGIDAYFIYSNENGEFLVKTTEHIKDQIENL